MNKMALIIVIVVALLMFAGGLAGGGYLVIEDHKAKMAAEAKAQEIEERLEEKKEPALTEEHLKKVAQDLEAWKADLETQKTKLLELDQALVKREQVLLAEREALHAERARVEEMQKNLESGLLKVESNETAALEELATLFSKMKPETVVSFLKEFPDDETSRLLTFIPQRQLVKVLEVWSRDPSERERLVRVTAEIRRVLKPQSQEATPNETTEL